MEKHTAGAKREKSPSEKSCSRFAKERTLEKKRGRKKRGGGIWGFVGEIQVPEGGVIVPGGESFKKKQVRGREQPRIPKLTGKLGRKLRKGLHPVVKGGGG